jgi:hypothetical protein
MSTLEIIISVVVGLLSGIVSSTIVYIVSKKREEKNQIFNYWNNYLFSALKECDMHFPNIEGLSSISKVGKQGSKWYSAILNIEDILHTENSENRVLSQAEIELSENVIIALGELYRWNNRKRSHKKR